MTPPYRSQPAKVEEPGLLFKIWNWFINPNYESNRSIAQRYNDANYPHVHTWEFLKTVRNKWRLVNGKPVGQYYDIDQVIEAIKENPKHTETKLVDVENWKSAGNEIVHVSFNVYKCKICGASQHAEAYVTPSKRNGVSIIDFKTVYKKTTQRLPTVYRREIPVEKMPRYK